MSEVGWKRARLLRFALPLVRPLATAHGAIALREGLLVELEDESGRRAYGEATPLPEFGTESLVESERALHGRLEEGAHGGAAPGVSTTPCADFAWSTAWHGLAALGAGERLADRLARAAGRAGAAAGSVASQGLVGGTTPEEVGSAARALAAQGFTAFKLKLAVSREARDLGVDLDRVAALREEVGGGARIRLDANEAWGEDEARRASAALARFDVDYVEQPVAREDVAALARLASEGRVGVAADEALLGDGWRRCLEEEAIRVFVAKPAALGSLDVAIAFARRVAERGDRLVWSTLIDGAVGRGAARAMAAATGARDEVHGLGTGPLLAKDLCAESDPIVDGAQALPAESGLGVVPSSAVLEAAHVVLEVEG